MTILFDRMVYKKNKNKDYIGYGKIINISIDTEIFVITCEKKNIYVRAYGDCCSYSWFEYPINFNQLIGKRIKNIRLTDQYTDLPFSGKQDYDKNLIAYIDVEKENPIMFYLRNSSNGYYGGWFEVTFEENFKPIVNSDLTKYNSNISDISVNFN